MLNSFIYGMKSSLAILGTLFLLFYGQIFLHLSHTAKVFIDY